MAEVAHRSDGPRSEGARSDGPRTERAGSIPMARASEAAARACTATIPVMPTPTPTICKDLTLLAISNNDKVYVLDSCKSK